MALKSRTTSVAAAAVLALTGACLIPSPATAAEEATETLAVDFANRTGAFRGGASGTLYGFGDAGSPTQALINGAHITNTSQKPPRGLQHPSGDSSKIEESFTAKHGEDLIIYMQDLYPDWGYHGGVRPQDSRTYAPDGTWTATPNGRWDYLEVVEVVTTSLAETADDPEKYILKPFNEPDGIWYQNWPVMRDQFLADWQVVFAKIREIWAAHGLGEPRIAGTGESHWDSERTRDFFEMASRTDTVPDLFVWHELGIQNIADFDGNLAEYRAIEREFGVQPLPINITEWGMLRDMGVPGQLVQWFSTFEDAKVDAQSAYWNYAGNFSDNSARANGANGGWWLFKWYGDLAGSETVKVTPPQPNTVESLQGIGAIDQDNERATVLFGGGSQDVNVAMTGLDAATFGDAVDVEVREVRLNGAQGLSDTPRVVWAKSDVAVDGGSLSLPVDTLNAQAAYQVIVTPAGDRDVEADAAGQAWQISVEAEAATLTDASTYAQDPQAGGGWNFQASSNGDVGSFNRVTSRADWTVEVPRDGTYRFDVLGGANGQAGKHAVFVGDQDAGTLEYTAGLALRPHHQWKYRGTASVELDLKAGSNVISVRASRDGVTRLPGSDITLDTFTLTETTDGEPVVYPASTFRLYGEAAQDHAADSAARGAAELNEGDRADLYVTAMQNGYHDVTVRWTAAAAGTVKVTVNGNDIGTVTAESAGTWDSTIRTRLAEGINEIELRGTGAHVHSVTTTTAAEADGAAKVIEAEAATVSGTAAVTNAPSRSNASGGQLVHFIGNGEGNALSIARGEGFNTAGDYDIELSYANAELVGDHAYNPQVVDRRLDVSEGGEVKASTHFRYTLGWDSFWTRTMSVSLSTGDQPIVLGNPDAFAPNIDRITIAPRTIGTPTSVPVETGPVNLPDLAVTTAPVISGKTTVGSALSATAGVYAPAAESVSYQWLRAGEKIDGATSASYKVVAADAGKKISVTTTAARSGYDSVSATSSTVTISKKFARTPKPAIIGSVVVGKKVTAAVSSSPKATATSYQWSADGKAIAGAKSASYTVKKADGGKKLTVTVTLSRAGYETTKVTSSAKTVVKVFTSVATPKISGTAVVGKKLTATISSNPGATKKTYQWSVNGKKVAGAKSSTYTVKKADAGKRVTVTVAVHRDGYQSVAKTSAPKRVAAK